MTFRPTLGAMALAFALHAHTAIAAAASSSSASERIPLNLDEPSGSHAAVPGGGGSGLLRTLIGLAVVVAVIWGVAWVLRQVKSGKEGRASGNGLASLATLPLGPNRAVHVVRVGSDVLLLGSADHQISQLARYSEDEAQRAGLLDLGGGERPSGGGGAAISGLGGGVVDLLRSWTVRK